MHVRDDCIFCQIVAGSARSHKVWEDEHTLVFMDLFPVAHGHTLIIPKPHWENLFEVSDDAARRVVTISRRLAHAMRSSLTPDGIAVFQLNGAAAGQTVFHYHMHLVPRAHGSKLDIHGRRRASRDELDEVAARIAGHWTE